MKLKKQFLLENHEPTKTLENLESYKKDLVQLAQKVYDEWDEEDVDTYAGGGICHLIADEFIDFLSYKNIEATTMSSNQQQHVFTIALTQDGIILIDIPPGYYETGGGFSWQKIPDVKFDESYIQLSIISTDLSDWDGYTQYE